MIRSRRLGEVSVLQDLMSFFRERNLPKALQAMETMQAKGVWADAITYSELAKCCIYKSSIAAALCLHRHLFSSPNSYRPSTYLSNVLIHMHLKLGHIKLAENILFDDTIRRDVVSWTTMISYFTSTEPPKAVYYLILMIRDGVKPNQFTYSSVVGASGEFLTLEQLHCSIIKDGFDRHPFVISAAIDGYSKCGRPLCALSYFNEKWTSDLVVWNSMIAGLAQNEHGRESVEVFRKMKRRGIGGDHSTLTSLLRGCSGLDALEVGKQVHAHVMKSNRDLILHNCLLDMYCKCGCLGSGQLVFDRMVEKDVISWSSMILGLAQNGCSKDALAMFNAMKDEGIPPNSITFLGVLFACSHGGHVEDAWHYFRWMKRNCGIDPGKEHYGCMIDVLGRAGKLEEAVNLMGEMTMEADAVTWKTLLAACKIHKNVEIAAYAAGRVLELEPRDAGTHVLLSNVYAKAGQWGEVAEVRRRMDELGMRKQAGCSWIEVKREVHGFVVGDDKHPRIKEIRDEVAKLIERVAPLGYVPDTNFVLQDVEEEQGEASLRHHSEKLALAFGLITLPAPHPLRIRKNLRMCGDCHLFAKLLSKLFNRSLLIRDTIRYHHFRDGACSCGDYW